MGDAELTAEEIAAWFNSRGVRYRLSGGTTITDLAQLYIEEGAAERVRPSSRSCRRCSRRARSATPSTTTTRESAPATAAPGQIPFVTPRDGVRGQIQMLRNYADPDLAGREPGQPAVGADLRLRPRCVPRSPTTPSSPRARAPTWNLMGNGNWATDPGYSPKVLTLYFQLMGHATRRP